MARPFTHIGAPRLPSNAGGMTSTTDLLETQAVEGRLTFASIEDPDTALYPARTPAYECFQENGFPFLLAWYIPLSGHVPFPYGHSNNN
jgi:hypothetical protein